MDIKIGKTADGSFWLIRRANAIRRKYPEEASLSVLVKKYYGAHNEGKDFDYTFIVTKDGEDYLYQSDAEYEQAIQSIPEQEADGLMPSVSDCPYQNIFEDMVKDWEALQRIVEFQF